MFEEFYQARTPLHATVKGTGLGLSFVQRVATALGARRGVLGARGAGSRFTSSCPRGPDGGPAMTESAATAVPVVLVCDDTPAKRYVLVELAAARGLRGDRGRHGRRGDAASASRPSTWRCSTFTCPTAAAWTSRKAVRSDPPTRVAADPPRLGGRDGDGGQGRRARSGRRRVPGRPDRARGDAVDGPRAAPVVRGAQTCRGAGHPGQQAEPGRRSSQPGPDGRTAQRCDRPRGCGGAGDPGRRRDAG